MFSMSTIKKGSNREKSMMRKKIKYQSNELSDNNDTSEIKINDFQKQQINNDLRLSKNMFLKPNSPWISVFETDGYDVKLLNILQDYAHLSIPKDITYIIFTFVRGDFIQGDFIEQSIALKNIVFQNICEPVMVANRLFILDPKSFTVHTYCCTEKRIMKGSTKLINIKNRHIHSDSKFDICVPSDVIIMTDATNYIIDAFCMTNGIHMYSYPVEYFYDKYGRRSQICSFRLSSNGASSATQLYVAHYLRGHISVFSTSTHKKTHDLKIENMFDRESGIEIKYNMISRIICIRQYQNKLFALDMSAIMIVFDVNKKEHIDSYFMKKPSYCTQDTQNTHDTENNFRNFTVHNDFIYVILETYVPIYKYSVSNICVYDLFGNYVTSWTISPTVESGENSTISDGNPQYIAFYKNNAFVTRKYISASNAIVHKIVMYT